MTIEYLDVEAARAKTGLRLALTAGVPAPYSMSARAILDLKGVLYIPVEQTGGGANNALVAWTGHRNAPVAVYEQEAPRTGWLDILNLAERLGQGPSLLPDDLAERMAMIGLTNEMIGENGLIWNMRLLMLGLAGPERAAKEAERNPMYADYGYSESARQAAPAKIKAVLNALNQQLHRQHDTNHQYLFGNRLSAIDVYWAYFSLIFQTLPENLCPMPSYLRKSYDLSSQAVGGCSVELIAHRDLIFEQHLPLPMTF